MSINDDIRFTERKQGAKFIWSVVVLISYMLKNICEILIDFYNLFDSLLPVDGLYIVYFNFITCLYFVAILLLLFYIFNHHRKFFFFLIVFA